MKCKKLRMLPIECIVRGYITGSGWASYKENGTVCGIELPAGLKESDKLPEPIYTPSTKAEIGDHDENISFERSIEVLEKEGVDAVLIGEAMMKAQDKTGFLKSLKGLT